MQPSRDFPGVGEQPDTSDLTRDYVGVGERVPDAELFDPENMEETGGAMLPGSSRSPAAITDEFPRKFTPDGTAREAPHRPQQL